jgi:hypothetical protein
MDMGASTLTRNLQPGFGDVYPAAARVDTIAHRQPASGHERLQVARQRGRTHVHAPGQFAGCQRTQLVHVCEQRVLRDLETRAREVLVVVLGHAARELTQLEVRAAHRRRG